MSQSHRTVVLHSDRGYGRAVPPAACGRFVVALDAQIRRSVSMAFRGRSRAAGRAPVWLLAATDIRLVGIEGAEASIVRPAGYCGSTPRPS